MGQPFMSVFAAFVTGLVTESPGKTGLAEVEVARLNDFRIQLTSAIKVGRFLEIWNTGWPLFTAKAIPFISFF